MGTSLGSGWPVGRGAGKESEEHDDRDGEQVGEFEV
jgi:hypothetical protein